MESARFRGCVGRAIMVGAARDPPQMSANRQPILRLWLENRFRQVWARAGELGSGQPLDLLTLLSQRDRGGPPTIMNQLHAVFSPPPALLPEYPLFQTRVRRLRP